MTTTKPAAVNMYAYNQFYTKNKRALFNFIFKMTRDAMVAEELVNDTFLKVYNAMHTFDESKASFRTWVYNIASNATVDYIRKKKVQTVSMYGLPDSDIDRISVMDFKSDDENPLESLMSTEARSKVDAALGQLTDTQANIVNHMINGYNYQDIADELDMPIGTVKSYIHHARVRMKEIFGKVPATV